MNKPNIHIITIAYGLADDLYRLVDNADEAQDRTDFDIVRM